MQPQTTTQKKTQGTNPLLSEVVIRLDNGKSYPLPLGSTKGTFTSTWLDRERVHAPKHEKPLIKGFLYGGQKYTNSQQQEKKLPAVALVTIDVDDSLRSEILGQKVMETFTHKQVFLSTSSSGHTKAHLFVDLESFRQSNRWFDAGEVSEALVRYLGCSMEKFDKPASSQCFLTESLLEVLESDKFHAWSCDELSTMFATASAEKEVESCRTRGHVKAASWKPQEAHFKAAERILASHHTGRSYVNCVKMLAWFLATPVHHRDMFGNDQRIFIMESISLASGVAISTISDVMAKLTRLGVLTAVKTKTRGGYAPTVYSLSVSSRNTNGLPIVPSTLLLSGEGCNPAILADRLAPEAVSGTFNSCEVQVCLAAVRCDWSFQDLLEAVEGSWKGWGTPRRIKRLQTTFKWACKKVLDTRFQG